jgi:hypothetical protein
MQAQHFKIYLICCPEATSNINRPSRPAASACHAGPPKQNGAGKKKYHRAKLSTDLNCYLSITLALKKT